MFRKHCAVGIIVLIALFSSCSEKDPDRYYNDKDDFSIKFPKEWENKEGFMGTAVISLSLKEGNADQFRENVNVVVEQLPREMSLDEYVDASIPNLAKVITDFRENEKGITTINDHDARWLVYSGRMGMINLKCIQYYMVDGKRGYVITCSATSESYDNYRRTFDDVATSFEFE
jgi:hypothetical protein